MFHLTQDMPLAVALALAKYQTYLTFTLIVPHLSITQRTQTISGSDQDFRRLMVDHEDGMFQPLSCNANVTVDTCLGPDAVPFSTIVAAADHTPFSAIVQGVAVATQSSTCWGRPASNAINGDHFDISHTCENEETPAWWMVDFGDDNIAVDEGKFIAILAVFLIKGDMSESWFMIMIFVSTNNPKPNILIVCYISVRIVNRRGRWGFRMVGAEVEVLDADMNIVASKVVEDEQGELFTPLLSSALRRTIFADILHHCLFSNEIYYPLCS